MFLKIVVFIGKFSENKYKFKCIDSNIQIISNASFSLPGVSTIAYAAHERLKLVFTQTATEESGSGTFSTFNLLMSAG